MASLFALVWSNYQAILGPGGTIPLIELTVQAVRNHTAIIASAGSVRPHAASHGHSFLKAGEVRVDVADVYFRFVRGHVATLDDFRSQGALGRKLRSRGDERAFNERVSVYDDFDQTCEVAASIQYRRGSYLATLSFPAGHGIEVTQTGRNAHHFTVFADAERLLALVVGDPKLMPGAPEG